MLNKTIKTVCLVTLLFSFQALSEEKSKENVKGKQSTSPVVILSSTYCQITRSCNDE